MNRRYRMLAACCLAAVAVVALGPPASAQCAMCRTLLQTPEGRQMAAAFRSGILLLLAAPFSIFGIVAALAVRIHRKRSANRQTPTETV